MAVEGEVVEPVEESMDDTIRNTLREIEARGDGDQIDGIKAEVSTEDPSPSLKGVERQRDDSGKFVKNAEPGVAKPVAESQAPAPSEPGEAGVAPGQAGDAPPTLPDGRPLDLTRPPSSFKPAAKAAWAQVPEAVRADIYRRESEHHAGYRGIKENADFGQAMKGVVEPYRMLIESEGSTPDRAVASLLQTAATLRLGSPQQKQQAVIGIMRTYGIELPQIQPPSQDGQAPLMGGQPAVGQPPQFLDPRVDQILAGLQNQERTRAAELEQQSNAATERFMAAKGADGQPAYPFVDNVLQDMVERTGAIRRQNPSLSHDDVLKQAYEQACWANPETRAVLIQKAQAQAQQPAETLRRVEAAKRANAVNLPKRGALPAVPPTGSMEDTIRETYRNLMANS